MLGSGPPGRPGRGGGLGASLFGEESPLLDGLFDAQPLPAAGTVEPNEVQSVGTGVSAPEPVFGDEAAGLVEVQASSGAAAWRRRLAPRHRAAVRRYFDVDGTSASGPAGVEESEPTRDPGPMSDEDSRL